MSRRRSLKKTTITVWILGLSVLDQILKIVSEARFFDARFDIIPGFLEFLPKYNFDYSYLNQVLGLGMGFGFTLVSLVVGVVVFVMLYKLRSHFSRHKVLLDWAFIFLCSAVVCALFSLIFWPGVLDFIYLRPLFIFDMKDLYIWPGIACLFISRIKDRKAGVAIKWNDVKEFYNISRRER